VRAEALRLGLTIVYAAETHLHADFISGVRELQETEGATVLAPEVGPRGFAHTVLNDGDTLDLGYFTLQALATPGHSPEHLSYLLLDEGQIEANDLHDGMAAQQRYQLGQDRGQPLTRGRVHHRPALLQRRHNLRVVRWWSRGPRLDHPRPQRLFQGPAGVVPVEPGHCAHQVQNLRLPSPRCRPVAHGLRLRDRLASRHRQLHQPK